MNKNIFEDKKKYYLDITYKTVEGLTLNIRTENKQINDNQMFHEEIYMYCTCKYQTKQCKNNRGKICTLKDSRKK